MRPKESWIAIVVATTGTITCITALLHFLYTMQNNRLAWTKDLRIREHYLAVGQFYTQGFVVGFFLCFSLLLVAISLASLYRHHRSRSQLDPVTSRRR